MNINVKFVDTKEGDQSQLDIESIRASIVEAADHALHFLDKAGYEYTGDLNIAYICGKSELYANAILRANYRMDKYQANRDAIEVMRIWLSMYHHVELSDEAVDEYAKSTTENSDQLTSHLRHEAPHELDDETDIFIYKGANVDNLHDVMVHELWHLIESQAGVFRPSELIHEGTATYAQKKFLGMNPAVDNFNPEGSSTHAFYDLVAKIVKEELDAVNGYASMLFQPEFRKKLSARVKLEVLPLYFEAHSKENSEQQGSKLISNPYYAAFIADPTRENLIASFRSMGALKWADELEGQDISSFVEYTKRIIGKPSEQNSTN